jgi:hypothetical protein
MGRACSTHGEKRNEYRILVESQKERVCWEDLNIGGRIILQQILEGLDQVVWAGLIWLRMGTNGGLL